jgi:hypothetical protein
VTNSQELCSAGATAMDRSAAKLAADASVEVASKSRV